MQKLLLIITGSIAAPKALNLYQLLKSNYQITVLCTPSTFKFVKFPANIEVHHQFLSQSFYQLNDQVEHVDYGWQHDFIVVYPATMNFISKAASAICDNLALATFLASSQPKLIFPAMNSNMYLNPALQRQLKLLATDSSIILFEPEVGKLAEQVNGIRQVGIGRLTEPAQALEMITSAVHQKFSGKTVLISYGATRSYLDKVRFLTSKSSGKMGQSLINAFLQQGAKVIAVHGDISEPPIIHRNLTTKTADSNEMMLNTLKQMINHVDIFISAASLNDFQFTEPFATKIDKQSNQTIKTELISQIDVLTKLAEQKKQQIFIACSAQDQFDWATGIKKMELKHCDGIIINPYTVANQTKTTVKFYFFQQKYQFAGTKQQVAKAIVDVIATQLMPLSKQEATKKSN